MTAPIYHKLSIYKTLKIPLWGEGKRPLVQWGRVNITQLALCLKSKGAVEVHSLPLQAAQQTLPLSKYYHWHLCPRPYLMPWCLKKFYPLPLFARRHLLMSP